MKKKLLVLTSTFPRWQNDTDPPFVYELSSRLTDEFDVTVLAPHYPGAEKKEIMSGMQVCRFRYFFEKLEILAGSTGILPTLKHNRLYYLLVPFFLTGQLLSLLLLCHRLKPDVLHAHWLIPQGLMAFIAEKVTGIPYIVTAHGADVFGLRGTVFRRLKRMIVRRARAVTVVSKALSDALQEIYALHSPVKIIPMGVCSRTFSPDRKESALKEKYGIHGPFLLYVGRLTEKKGVGFLIESMTRVIQEFPACKLLIIGSGELKDVLTQKVEELRLLDNVIFLGALSNQEIPPFYATADLFIGSSIQTEEGDTEGFGLTFVEAAMSGCMIVGSDVGGISDIIKDNETGFLVPEKDSKAIADRVIYCLQNMERVKGIRERARKRCIDQYDFQVIARRYSELLQKI